MILLEEGGRGGSEINQVDDRGGKGKEVKRETEWEATEKKEKNAGREERKGRIRESENTGSPKERVRGWQK